MRILEQIATATLVLMGCGDDDDSPLYDAGSTSSVGDDESGLTGLPVGDASGDASTGTGDESTGTGFGSDGYPTLTAPCVLPVDEPTRFAVSSTDGSTGAIGLIDVATKTVQADLGLASTDIAMDVFGDHLYVINRFGFDYVDIFDLANSFSLLSEFTVAIPEDRSSNPHSVHVTDTGEAYVSLYGDESLQVFDVSDPTDVSKLRDVDLSVFADSDGLPEVSSIIACGDVAFVSIERLDRNAGWVPVDDTQLIPLRLGTDALFDWDEADGPDTVHLLGTGSTEIRRDLADESGHTLLVLNTGLERVDLATGSSEWVIEPSTFEALGIGQYQLRGFDLRGGTDEIYVSVSAADFQSHSIYRGTLSGGGSDLTEVVSGLFSVTADFEVVGTEGWFVDTDPNGSGVRVFDLSGDIVVEIGERLSTGLPPYGLLALP